MHSKRGRLVAALCFIAAAACWVALPVAADGDKHEKSERPAWTKTLTEAQRKEIGHQHHELDDAQGYRVGGDCRAASPWA